METRAEEVNMGASATMETPSNEEVASKEFQDLFTECQNLYETTDCKSGDNRRNLNIDYVDGVKLYSATLSYVKVLRGRDNYVFAIILELNSAWKSIEQYRATAYNAYELQKIMTEDLPNLKWNNKYSKFTVQDKIDGLTCVTFKLMQTIPECETIKLHYDACCVCLEMCKTKTSCQHPLCMKCETKITPRKVCPICRENYHHYAYQIEEEEDY